MLKRLLGLCSDETKMNVFGIDGLNCMVSQRSGVQRKMHGAYSVTW
ncbi:unnamed protein product [Staurois parvus]|uniref:Uncharacterized protein n=1 Tax=Staurois parvus TaxID=386267 RepID=A0ABN9EMB7_9NEOB|nr:unnamed protein product [Staurois parvus]